MKTKFLTLVLLGVVCLFSSCSTTQKTYSMVGDPLYITVMEGWITPKIVEIKMSDEVGVRMYACREFSMGKDMPQGKYGEILTDKFELLCGHIEGLDWESDRYQPVKLVLMKENEAEKGKNMNEWQVMEEEVEVEVEVDEEIVEYGEIIEDKEVVFLEPGESGEVGESVEVGGEYKEAEYKEIWIGPDLVEKTHTNWGGQLETSKHHQFQEGSFYRGGSWQPLYDISYNKDRFEPGYIYKVRYVRLHPIKIKPRKGELADYEPVIMDSSGPAYQVRGVEILQKIKQ